MRTPPRKATGACAKTEGSQAQTSPHTTCVKADKACPFQWMRPSMAKGCKPHCEQGASTRVCLQRTMPVMCPRTAKLVTQLARLYITAALSSLRPLSTSAEYTDRTQHLHSQKNVKLQHTKTPVLLVDPVTLQSSLYQQSPLLLSCTSTCHNCVQPQMKLPNVCCNCYQVLWCTGGPTHIHTV